MKGFYIHTQVIDNKDGSFSYECVWDEFAIRSDGFYSSINACDLGALMLLQKHVNEAVLKVSSK